MEEGSSPIRSTSGRVNTGLRYTIPLDTDEVNNISFKKLLSSPKSYGKVIAAENRTPEKGKGKGKGKKAKRQDDSEEDEDDSRISWYDTKDPFIDDDDLTEESDVDQPTMFDGFYVNEGNIQTKNGAPAAKRKLLKDKDGTPNASPAKKPRKDYADESVREAAEEVNEALQQAGRKYKSVINNKVSALKANNTWLYDLITMAYQRCRRLREDGAFEVDTCPRQKAFLSQLKNVFKQGVTVSTVKMRLEERNDEEIRLGMNKYEGAYHTALKALREHVNATKLPNTSTPPSATNAEQPSGECAPADDGQGAGRAEDAAPKEAPQRRFAWTDEGRQLLSNTIDAHQAWKDQYDRIKHKSASDHPPEKNLKHYLKKSVFESFDIKGADMDNEVKILKKPPKPMKKKSPVASSSASPAKTAVTGSPRKSQLVPESDDEDDDVQIVSVKKKPSSADDGKSKPPKPKATGSQDGKSGGETKSDASKPVKKKKKNIPATSGNAGSETPAEAATTGDGTTTVAGSGSADPEQIQGVKKRKNPNPTKLTMAKKKKVSEGDKPKKLEAPSEGEKTKKQKSTAEGEKPKKVKTAADGEKPKKVKTATDGEKPKKVKTATDGEKPKKVKPAQDGEKPKKVKPKAKDATGGDDSKPKVKKPKIKKDSPGGSEPLTKKTKIAKADGANSSPTPNAAAPAPVASMAPPRPPTAAAPNPNKIAEEDVMVIDSDVTD